MKLLFVRSMCLCCLTAIGLLQGQWTQQQSLSSPEEFVSPLFAADLTGNVLAIWTTGNTDSGYRIQSSMKLFDQDWQSTSDTIYTSSALPSLQLALDDAGNATVVWEEFDGTEHLVRALTKTFGEPWQATPDTIAAIPNSERFSSVCVHLVVDSAGNATVVWQTLSDPMVLQSSTKFFGQAWQQTPDIIAQGSYLTHIELVIDGAGDITAAWLESSDLIPIIYASTKMFGEPWPTTPDIVGSGNCMSFQLTTNINGDTALAWIDETSKVNVTTKSIEESWRAPSIIGRNADAWRIPQIIIDSAGNVTAAWVGSDGQKPYLQSSTKLSGQEWPRIPDTLVQGPRIALFQFASDPSGNITALFAGGYESHLLLQSSTKLFGQAWSTTPDTLCQTADVAQMKLAVDSEGNATALWISYDQEHSVFLTQVSTKRFGHTWTEVSTVSQNVDIIPELQLVLDADGNVTGGWAMHAGGEGDNTDDTLSSILQSSTQLKKLLSPTVTHLDRSGERGAGGNTVIITGTNFIDVSSVQFGSSAATFTVTSPTSITVISPTVSSSSKIFVTVTTPVGTSPMTDVSTYTYQLSPRPPGLFKGVLKKRKHARKHKYHLRTTWKPSCSHDVVYYRIYKRSKLIATTPANAELMFTARLHKKDSVKKFMIVAVTADELESEQKKVTVTQHS